MFKVKIKLNLNTLHRQSCITGQLHAQEAPSLFTRHFQLSLSFAFYGRLWLERYVYQLCHEHLIRLIKVHT